MRITNNMMMRRYDSHLSKNLNSMDQSQSRLAAMRSYLRASEDPMVSLKALQVRRNIRDLDQYAKNIEMADSWLAQTETVVDDTKRIIGDAVDLVIQGRNDPMSEEDRQIIAEGLRSLQDQLLKTLNTQVAGKFLVGGANTKKAPFEVDPDTGHLMYNGQDVFETESFEDYDFESVYFDLGMGFRLDDDDDLVDPHSAFDMYTQGVTIIGTGPDNAYNLIGRLAQAFEEDDMAVIDGGVPSDYEYSEYNPNRIVYEEQLVSDDPPVIMKMPVDPPDKYTYDYNDYDFSGDGIFKKLQDSHLNSIIQLVAVGERSKFVTYLQERTDSNLYQAEVMQNKLEAAQPERAIMELQMDKMVYTASLQMGSYILQSSLMDYLK